MTNENGTNRRHEDYHINPQVIPPIDVRLKVGPFEDPQSYLNWGRHEFDKLATMGELSPQDKVFDMGCGCGRVSIHIGEYLKEGFYVGMDNYLSLIRWCKLNIEPYYPNLKFQFINVYSGYYNPEGSLQASNLAISIPDNYFTFAFTVSLFTHMFLEDVGGYMKEISRVLCKGGRFYSTYFLLKNNQPYGKTQKSIFDDPQTPEKKISHAEEAIQELYDRNGFSITHIDYGNWRTGCPRYPESYQDTIIAIKQ